MARFACFLVRPRFNLLIPLMAVALLSIGSSFSLAAPLPPPSVTVYVGFSPAGTQLGSIQFDLAYGSGVSFGAGAFINEGLQFTFNHTVTDSPTTVPPFVRGAGTILFPGAVTVSANPIVEIDFSATPSTTPLGGFSIIPDTPPSHPLVATDQNGNGLNVTTLNFPITLTSPARLLRGPFHYTDLPSACAAPALQAGDTIAATAAVTTANLNLAQNLPFTILGGFDTAYSSQVGYTSIAGVMTVAQGEVTVDRLIVR